MDKLNECINVMDEIYDSELAMDARAELATLRAENEKLRDALAHIMSRYEEGTIAYWKAKEALK